MVEEEKDMEILCEDKEGNWIQVHYDDDGNPVWYDVFLVENTLCISMSYEAFNNIKELFRKIMQNPTKSYVS